MFLTPLSLQNISRLRHPSERVPLGERVPYEEGLHLIESGAFATCRLLPQDGGLFYLQLDFEGGADKPATVAVNEEKIRGPLHFACSLCQSSGCPHQWASYVMLWQALTLDEEHIQHPDLVSLSRSVKGPAFLGASDYVNERSSEFAGIELESISLFLDEKPLLEGQSLASLLNAPLGKYKKHEVSKDEELLSPRLWNLPEVFRRKLTAFSEHYFNEVHRQNKLADMVRYNFSNHIQISAKEILRHPLHKQVPAALLPQGKTAASVFARWPLLNPDHTSFTSQALYELEEILQALLAQIADEHRRGRLDVFVQSPAKASHGLKLKSLEFDTTQELDWRVDFHTRKDELLSEFKLVSFRKQDLHFFENFAVDAENGILLIHAWAHEFNELEKFLQNSQDHFTLPPRKMPRIELQSEPAAKSLLKYLRSRGIPVKIEGETKLIPASQGQVQVHLNEEGQFYILHEARVLGQKNLARQGFSSRSLVFLETLSLGLGFLLKTDAKDMASRSRLKRDWDLKILRHLGILQYLALETLSFYFEGTLTDGRKCKAEEIFSFLQPHLQSLLITGSGGSFVKDVPLTELCSKAVLSCFEDFIQMTLKSIPASEAFYSEDGEVILESLVEKEFRLIFELLKRLALSSGGEAFKKSRTAFLAKIASSEGLYYFPSGSEVSDLHSSLESLQPLLPYGFKIFYKDQPLQELEEDEFHVDFVLETDMDNRQFNWFELNPHFFLRGEEVDPDRFLSLGRGGVVEYDGKLFLVPQKQMPSLRRLENFWEKLQGGKNDLKKKNNDDRIYRLPRHQTLELLALRASGVSIRGDHEWQKLCDFYDSLSLPHRPLNLETQSREVLKPYQAHGVQWLQDLYQLRLGALLADDMGLGKTLQTLAFLDDLREKEDLGRVLIVVPSSLIFNWLSEAEKFTPRLNITLFSNRDSDRIGRELDSPRPMVVLTTYGLLMEHEDFLCQFKWKILVFDEAQNLKNITTKRTSAARSLSAQFKICLTGTPMENHYGEFYSLVDLLVPGSLGKIEDFRRQFVNTDMITWEEMQDLKLKIKPLLLRRTKKEILDQLPDKQETKVSIAFEERQKEIYRDIALSYNQRVKETMAAQGEASVQLQMLTALLRLRQACSDPAALPNVHYDKVPPKLETLLDSLREIVESGESALVFTQFLQTLEHATRILKAAGIPVFQLHGGIPAKQRQKILAEFTQSPAGAVLVMTLKTGGVGLNLTKASYVFHLEPWWNPSVENQATDRAHRLGQSKAVQVFRYIMHESLEEKMELLKSRKDKKFQTLFTEAESAGDLKTGQNALSRDDFDFLLGLK